MTIDLDSIKSIFESCDLAADEFDLTSLFSSIGPDDRIADLRLWAIQQARGDKDKFEERFNRAYRRWLASQLIGDWPESVTDMVSLYMGHHQISVGFNGLLTSPPRASETLDLQTIGCELRLAVSRVGLPYRDNVIADALSTYVKRAKDARLIAAFGALNTTEPHANEALWDALVAAVALTDGEHGSPRYVKRVLQTFIWQVLRRLANDPAKPVYSHLMPILCGKQGCGKSSFVQRLVEPVADLMIESNFKKLTDAKDLSLPRFPIVFMDEMENAERSDVEAVKNAITRSTAGTRLHCSHDHAVIPTRNVFIGATNGTLADKITDTTGQRRFAPIHTKLAPLAENIAADLPVVDWEALNGLDVLALWQSVDWRGEHPLQADPEAKAEWLRLIEEERNQDSVEAWLRSVNVQRLDTGDDLFTADLYGGVDVGYHDWSKNNGFSPMSVNKFGRMLKRYSTEPWYPFAPPRPHTKGTAHALKRDAAVISFPEPSNVQKLNQRLLMSEGERLRRKQEHWKRSL